MQDQPRVTVVIATRDRRRELLAVLERLCGLRERPRVLVVDNGSRDGTAAAAAATTGVDVVELRDNLGCGARGLGAALATTPYVAFSDDDSWWAEGSLEAGVALLDRHPGVGLVAARVLVGPEEQLDPVSALMRRSPLGAEDSRLPGRPVLGFLACASIVRRSALLAAGGFERRLGIGGEEQLLAIDLVTRGWGVIYADELVAHHHPSARRDPAARRRVETRNALWTSWLRRRGRSVVRDSLRSCRAAMADAEVRAGVLDAVRALPWVVGERRPVPAWVEADLRGVELSAQGC
jgi:GT2 family glycosyltransferase